MQLRHYQTAALEAAYRWMPDNDGNPLIVIPTGGGKTPVIASLCNDAVTKWQGRVVVLAHVKELLEQTAGTIGREFPGLWTGVYSAGLGSRDVRPPVVVAGIQSVFDRAKELGPRDLIIVDEAHLIPPSGFGRYRTFIDDMKQLSPHTRIAGLTATPYRTGTGWLHGPEEMFAEIVYEIGVRQLIDEGFLSPLKSKCGKQVDTSGLHIKRGEFVESEASGLMMQIVNEACAQIVKRTEDRRSVLIFCTGIEHAEAVQKTLRMIQGNAVELITGESIDFDRAKHIADFKSGALKYLVNVNVLTTGFDAPNVDCIALLRPTASPGLYYQMVGRGFRIAPGKENCLVLDFGNNVDRHGPIDHVQPRNRKPGETKPPPQKVCPGCQEYISLAATECPECGFLFDRNPPRTHDAKPAEAEILSVTTREELRVYDVRYFIHRKKGWEEGAPCTLRVRYRIVEGGNLNDHWNCWRDEWICFEHTGYARQKAEAWWRARSNDPIPSDCESALAACEAGAIANTLAITVESKTNDKFPRIVKYEIGPIPEIVLECNQCGERLQIEHTECPVCGAPQFETAAEPFEFPVPEGTQNFEVPF
ncbi:MAG: DEAD/DEAH box helicase family protein [Burkholderiales bacterium]